VSRPIIVVVRRMRVLVRLSSSSLSFVSRLSLSHSFTLTLPCSTKGDFDAAKKDYQQASSLDSNEKVSILYPLTIDVTLILSLLMPSIKSLQTAILELSAKMKSQDESVGSRFFIPSCLTPLSHTHHHSLAPHRHALVGQAAVQRSLQWRQEVVESTTE
jgi:hypothetical protein